jgi:hypothetical protein
MADVAFLLLGAFLGVAGTLAVVAIVGIVQRRKRSKFDINVNKVE